MSESIVAETAKEETTRQTIILAFSVAGAVALVFVARTLDNPDFGRSMKMGGALALKRFAAGQVDWWQSIADKAGTVYNREKN